MGCKEGLYDDLMPLLHFDTCFIVITSYISLLYGYSMILLYNHSLILLYKIEQTKLSLLY